MKNNSKKLEKINTRIDAIRNERGILSTYKISDTSVQAELRLRADWTITYPVDAIHAPKNLRGNHLHPLWQDYWSIERNIDLLARIASSNIRDALRTIKINAATKSGPERRSEAKINFEIEAGTAFLAAHKAAVKSLPCIARQISALQADQKKILPELRRANSEYLSERKSAKSAERQADADAIASGRFWDASREALKSYFHPPFDKNYLADVSEKWRAALYVEAKSTGWKNSYGTWSHKLVSTGRAYLCGIDDNGDEWGHRVILQPAEDQYGNASLTDYSVAEAMCNLFDGYLNIGKINACTRQGDLLFCPETIPPVELHPQPEPWDIRESHAISSPGLYRNGRWFRSDAEITVSHTSHAPVTLPPGEYRLYTLQDAD